jgi:DNA-binding transcriptional LysR family regulator
MNKHKSTLEQWRILQAVVDFSGYAQAGEALHRSPSSLNHAVNKLQEQLGIELLKVQGRKARLTPQGAVLLRRSRQLSDDARLLEQLADSLQMGWEPELCIAVEPIFPRQRLFRALKTFYPVSRGTRIRVMDTVLTGTVEAINEGIADLAICAMPPKGYLGDPLGSTELLAVAHPEHALSRTKHPLTQQDLYRELQVVIRDSGKKPVEHLGWLKAEQRWTLDSFDAALELLYHGIGFCWLPEHLVRQPLAAGRLTQLCIREGRARSIVFHLVVPKPDLLGPCGQRLKSILLESGQPAEPNSFSSEQLSGP